jgi:protein phosphatase methylesterase 1
MKVVLVGHSMGGAIAARAASTNKITNLVGLVVIDVVEGTAMAALNSMHQILENRPSQFDTLENAIQWRYITL